MKLKSLALATLLGTALSPAHAELITVNISGTFLAEFNIGTSAQLLDGTSISGYYTYDTANSNQFTAWSVSTQASPTYGQPGGGLFPAFTYQSGATPTQTAGFFNLIGPGTVLFCAVDCNGAGIPPIALIYVPNDPSIRFVQLMSDGSGINTPGGPDFIALRLALAEVPVPATHALLGLGLAVAGIAARRARKD
jgi:hypothetical protein